MTWNSDTINTFENKSIVKTEYVEVRPGEEKTQAALLERQWIRQTLIRLSVPELKIDQAEYDPNVSSSAWRNYLFETFGLEVILDRHNRLVKISRVDPGTGKKMMVGEWHEPIIARNKELTKPSRLILQYT